MFNVEITYTDGTTRTVPCPCENCEVLRPVAEAAVAGVERLVEHQHAEAVMRAGGPDVERLAGTVFLP